MKSVMKSVVNSLFVFLLFCFYTIYGSDLSSSVKNSLMEAVTTNNLETLEKIMDVDENENVLSQNREYGEKLLHNAARLGHLKIVEYLVSEQHVTINEEDTFIAAIKDNYEVLHFLIEKGADPYAIDEYNDTLLHKAVRSNNLNTVKELVQYKLLLNATNILDSAPIDITKGKNEHSTRNYSAVIKVLVEAGSYVPDQLIWNFWYFNVSNDMLKLLISKSGKVNVRVPWSKSDCRESLLMMLLTMEQIPYDMVKFMLEQGADANIVYCSNTTALHRAAYYERENTLQIIKLLLDKNADINAVDFKGSTPLDIAEKRGNKKVVEYLKKFGGTHNWSE